MYEVNLYLIKTAMKITSTLLWVLFPAAIFLLAGCSGMDRAEQGTIKDIHLTGQRDMMFFIPAVAVRTVIVKLPALKRENVTAAGY